MIYAAKNSAGAYTGAAYISISSAITAYHARFGETLDAVASLSNAGSDDTPDWQAVALDGDALAELVRADRDALLAACDWTQLSDVAASVDQASWATYRQALRDVPDQAGFPSDVIWPDAPTL